MRPALERRISTLRLNSNVALGTWAARQYLPAIYNQADIFILPSPEEGLPNVILEAMASGLPVIASDTLKHESLVLDGVNGFLVEPRKPNAIKAAITKFLDNPTLISEMGHAARTHMEQHFSWQATAAAYQEFLEIQISSPTQHQVT